MQLMFLISFLELIEIHFMTFQITRINHTSLFDRLETCNIWLVDIISKKNWEKITEMNE